MLTRFARAAAPLSLVLILAACTSGPQAPSDTVDDKAAESAPFNQDTQSPSAASGTYEAVPDVPEPVTSVSADADMAAISGEWAPTADDCAAEGAVVTISPSRFASIDRICEIADTIAGGGGNVTATLRCNAGDTLAESALVKLSPTDAGLDVNFIGGDQAQSLVRCP